MTRVAFKQQLTKWSSVISALAFVALWAGSYLAHGVFAALDFGGFPANGPFQLFNPLRRIAAGQTAGVQFQFFHGLGIPFLHYPLFWLFGKTIFASELSRHLTAMFCYLAPLAVFAYVATRKDWKRALYFCALTICISEFFNLHVLKGPGNLLAVPGNSLLGVRSAFPLVAFALLLTQMRPSLKAALLGVSLGLSLWLGTEHGLALAAGFTLVSLVVVAGSMLRSRSQKGRKEDGNILRLSLFSPSGPAGASFSLGFFLLTLVSAVGSIALIYWLCCGFAGALPALRYNLIEVPRDQFWYFGVPPNDFASAWIHFFYNSGKGTLMMLALMVWLAISLLQSVREAGHRRLSWQQLTVTVMLAYAIISCASCFGMLEQAYLFPMLRIAILLPLMLAFRGHWLEQAFQRVRGQRRSLEAVALAVVVVILGAGFLAVSYVAIRKLPPMGIVTARRPVAQLSIWWKKYMAQVIPAINSSRGGEGKLSIWSTYSGLLEDHYQVFHPREDYIIHALGPERRARYLAAFHAERPDFVQTIRRSLFITYAEKRDYEQWLRGTSWDFYESVLRNYDILTVTDRSVIWKRKAGPWAPLEDNYECFPVRRGAQHFEIPKRYAGGQFSLLVVKLRYRLHNPWRRLPVLGSLPRFLVILENAATDLPVSLPPYAEEVRFPIIWRGGEAPRLRFQTFSLIPGASYTVEEVHLKTLGLTAQAAIFLED